jgi:hypothetical protein
VEFRERKTLHDRRVPVTRGGVKFEEPDYAAEETIGRTKSMRSIDAATP